VRIVETVSENRLAAALTYGAEAGDTFDWQLFTPEGICGEAAAWGLQPALICSEFDERTPAATTRPRMQVIFVRP
jgi:hypothetical protein